jgi:hypothetical protein
MAVMVCKNCEQLTCALLHDHQSMKKLSVIVVVWQQPNHKRKERKLLKGKGSGNIHRDVSASSTTSSSSDSSDHEEPNEITEQVANDSMPPQLEQQLPSELTKEQLDTAMTTDLQQRKRTLESYTAERKRQRVEQGKRMKKT